VIPVSRFYWEGHGRRGVARHDGVEIELHSMPHIAGLPDHVAEIDFIAGTHRGELRISADAKREMTGDECEAAQAWLLDLSARVRELVQSIPQ
jgi:hypothetical protein